jgi:hypothetical protein
MKYATARPYADPENAARRILEIANAVEPVQGRIHIEKINEPFLFRGRGSPAEYSAGLKLAIERLAQDARIRDLRRIHARRRPTTRMMAKTANVQRCRWRLRDGGFLLTGAPSSNLVT